MKKLTQEDFIEKAKAIHGNKYDYSKAEYKNYETKIPIGCSKHGIFYQKVGNHLNGAGCSKCKFELNRLTLEEFLNKATKIHGSKYDYSKVNYINNATKVCIVCPDHGEFYQSPRNHLIGQECGICGKNKISLTNQEYIRRAKEVHGDKYSYSKVDYKHNKIKIIITCLKHGDFEQIPNDHLSGHGCGKCQKSKGEIAISKILNKYNIHFVEEYKIPGTNYKFEYDFYLSELNILIEFHGQQHFTYIPFFHKTEEYFLHRQKCDIFKKELAKIAKISLLEFNHKQFDTLSEIEFEQLVLNAINSKKS